MKTMPFELHCAGTQGAADRRCFVKTRYTVASPRQQREATVLDATTPPSEAVLVLPGCGVELCPLAAFVGVVLDAVCFDCVGDPVRTVLEQLAEHAAAPPAAEACDAAPAWQQALSLLGAAAIGASLALFVGPSGAGMFNLVHCRAGTRVLQLEPLPDWIEGHAAILGSLGSVPILGTLGS